ncbi:Uncharacterised protein [Salmonella enterica subsp. enterica serovar Typhimurium str. DT104]|nr:Uncharacterised protein [Salmonella enterica subsp. enterica serovar Typhimurium str. DT104]
MHLKINFKNSFIQLFLMFLLIFLLMIFLFPLYYLILNASLPDELQDNPNLSLKLDSYL